MPEVIVVLEKLLQLPLTERATLCEITDEKDANFVRSERLAIVPRDEPKLVARMRDELLDGEVFDTLLEAKVLIERWRVQYNTKRPHSSLGYQPPAPEVLWPPLPPSLGAAPLRRQQWKSAKKSQHSRWRHS